MIPYKHKRLSAIGAAVLCVWAAAVFAASDLTQVDAPWPLPEQNATSPEPPEPREPRNVALQRGLSMAVEAEAARLLPDTVSPAQRELLAATLEERTNDFVRSYSLVGEVSTPEGQALRMLVDVNKRSLKNTLNSMGLLQPRRGAVPYALTLDGPAGARTEIGRLELLANVSQTPNAELQLMLRHVDEVWSGRLARGNATNPAIEVFGIGSGEHLEDVWWDVWAGYFGRGPVMPVSSQDGVVLAMEGWFTADGVQAFDKLLESWVSPAGESVLTDVTMESVSLSGRWLLRNVDPGPLRSRLEDYVAGRNLTWRLENRTE